MLRLIDYNYENFSYIIVDEEFISKDEVEGWIILELEEDLEDIIFLDCNKGPGYNLEDLLNDYLGEIEREIGVIIEEYKDIRSYLQFGKIFIHIDFYGVV